MNPQTDFNTLVEKTRHTFCNTMASQDCPDAAVWVDYVYGDLDQIQSGRMATHLHTCEACHIRKLKMEADRTEWEVLLERNPDRALSKALGPAGLKIFKPKEKRSKATGISVSAIKEALITWTSPLWLPALAGEMMTASADIPEQSRHFKMEYGEYINISCAWKGRDRSAPCITLAWNANIFTDSNLWARFMDPETGNILFESCLGEKLEGEKTFSQQELGFDPCYRKWAVAIIVEEAA